MLGKLCSGCFLPWTAARAGCEAAAHETDHDPLDPGFGVLGGAFVVPGETTVRGDPAQTSGRTGQVSGGSLFSTALRGYHHRQVDERIAVLTEQADAQRIRAEAAESDLSAALDQLRNTPQGGDADRGFGVRVEKLLRLAETEAAEVRTTAAQEATTLIEQARVDAQAHRGEVENELTASAASVDQDNASRTARLNDREQEIDDQLAAAREQAAAIRAEADRDAAQVCEQAERELDRLTAVCAAVRTEMAKLHSVLGAELNLSDKIAIAQQS